MFSSYVILLFGSSFTEVPRIFRPLFPYIMLSGAAKRAASRMQQLVKRPFAKAGCADELKEAA